MAQSTLIESTRQRLHVVPPSSIAVFDEATVQVLELPMQQQEQTNWCWAAVTVTVFDYYRHSSGSRQCEVANLELGQNCCPQNPDCNRVATLDNPLKRNQNLRNFQASRVTFSVLTTEINNRRPLGCRVLWFGGGSHFLLIHGFTMHGSGLNTMELADPWFGPSTQNFDTFPSDYQLRGRWTHTYFTKP